MKSHGDWPGDEQHQHHPAACFMLAAGVQRSTSLARHLHSFLSSIHISQSFYSASDSMGLPHATQVRFPRPKNHEENALNADANENSR
jgi:hypothetical protein